MVQLFPRFEDRESGVWQYVRAFANLPFSRHASSEGRHARGDTRERGVRELVADVSEGDAIAHQLAALTHYHEVSSPMVTEIIVSITVDAAQEKDIPIIFFLTPVNLELSVSSSVASVIIPAIDSDAPIQAILNSPGRFSGTASR